MGFKFTFLVSLAFLFLSPGVRADQQAEYDYREQYGPANVLWMHGLLEDYQSDRLSQSDLLRELWAERPGLMAALYADYGEFNECFQVDLITAQANGMKFMQGTQRVFYNSAAYLDSQSNVVVGYERAYNTALRANALLNEAYDRNTLLDCPLVPANNQCCHENGLGIECNPQTNKRCSITNPNQLNCDQNNGNPCS